MALIDDLSADVGELDLERRKLLAVVTGGTFAIAGLGTAITIVSFLRPNVLFEPPSKFTVGRPDDIAKGQLVVMPEQKIYVVHVDDGFVALSAACTHLGCMTRYEEAKKKLTCPCHGSVFSLDGKVAAGPAPKPLERRQLEIKDGLLVVDVTMAAADDFVLKV